MSLQALMTKLHMLWLQGTIEAIYLDEGELISAGADGYVRVWDFETIDNADITEENVTFEMDPLTEIKVRRRTLVLNLPTPPTTLSSMAAGTGPLQSSYSQNPWLILFFVCCRLAMMLVWRHSLVVWIQTHPLFGTPRMLVERYGRLILSPLIL